MFYYITAIGQYKDSLLPYLEPGPCYDLMSEGTIIITDTTMTDDFEESIFLGQVCGIDVGKHTNQLIEGVDLTLLEKYVEEKKLPKSIANSLKVLYENKFKLFLRLV